MNDEPSRELALFAAALKLPAEDRAAYLARECGDDHALRERVETLLRVDSDAGDFMEQSPGDVPAARSNVIGEKPGHPRRKRELPGITNSPAGGHLSEQAKLIVIVEQFDVDHEGNGTLIAQWRMTNHGSDESSKCGETRIHRRGEPPQNRPDLIARTLSDATAELSYELAPILIESIKSN